MEKKIMIEALVALKMEILRRKNELKRVDAIINGGACHDRRKKLY